MNHPIPLYSRISGDNMVLPTTQYGTPMFTTAINRYTDDVLYVDLVGNLRYGAEGRVFRPAMIKPPQQKTVMIRGAWGGSPFVCSVDSIVAATYSDIPFDYAPGCAVVCSVERTDLAPHPSWALTYLPGKKNHRTGVKKQTYDYATPIAGELWADLPRLNISVSSENRVKLHHDMERCITVPRTDHAVVRVGHAGNFFLHRLVCEAFHGQSSDGRTTVDHRDGDASNNHQPTCAGRANQKTATTASSLLPSRCFVTKENTIGA
jgi:hypothetical protein